MSLPLAPLLSFLERDDTGLSLLSHSGHTPTKLRTGLIAIDRANIDAGAVVEVVGRSGSGKTTILMHAAITCVLPHELGGEAGDVIYFDGDLRLDIPELRARLRRRVKEKAPTSDIQRVVTACLERVHIFRCSSSFEMLATIHSIRSLLDQPCRNVRLLVIDSLASFWWRDNATEPKGGGFHVSIPNAIKELRRFHSFNVLAAKPLLFRSAQVCYLSKTWQSLVTLRLMLDASSKQTGKFVVRVCMLADDTTAQTFTLTVGEGGSVSEAVD